METFQVIGATAAMLLAVIGAVWGIVTHQIKALEVRVDKKFDRIDHQFQIMNGQIFDLAMALRPHIQEAQTQKVPA